MHKTDRQFSRLGLIAALGAVLSITIRLQTSGMPPPPLDLSQYVLSIIAGWLLGGLLDRFWHVRVRVIVGIAVFTIGLFFWDKIAMAVLAGIVLLSPWAFTRGK